MKNIAIDANLLVLFCIGSINPELVARHKRTSAFSTADHERLLNILSGAERLVVLPYVMAEVSNLLDRDRYWSGRIVPLLRELMAHADELPVSSERVFDTPQVGWLGLTDAAWVAELDDTTLLLSVDARLVSSVLEAGKAAMMFERTS